jgi:hypothetical protein
LPISRLSGTDASYKTRLALGGSSILVVLVIEILQKSDNVELVYNTNLLNHFLWEPAAHINFMLQGCDTWREIAKLQP